jgi:Ca2+-binding RTX toxin-like protein
VNKEARRREQTRPTDTFHGNAGPDQFAGNAGDDAFFGGGGSDTALFDSSNETQGPEGPVHVNLTTGVGTGDGHDTFTSVENLVGSNVGGDTLIGNDKPNYIQGESSAGSVTVIRGRRGDDYLWGAPGADLIYGGRGNDQIFVNDGGSGNDTADGGRGTDLCRFDPGDIVKGCESW